jgi:integrase
VLAVTAGLRIGELLGLKWEDIDLDAETLRVRRTRSQAKSGPTFTTPKNGKGRSISLTQLAVEALKSHKAVQNTERLKLGDLWENTNLVFCTTAGKPWTFAMSLRLRLSRSSTRQDYRIYAFTTSATHAPRCYSPAATIPSWCKSYWDTLR